MDELHYFQTTEAPEKRMGGGRFVAAGCMLLLVAAGCGFVEFALLNIVLQFTSGRELFGFFWIVGMIGLVFVSLTTLGVGVLLRRRWSRPLILAACWPWLVCGLIFFVDMLTVVGYEFARSAGARRQDAMELLMIGGTFGTMATIGCFIPAACVLLLRRPGVQQALNDRDLTSRWTDSWPVAWLIALCSMIVLTLVTTSLCVDIFESRWPIQRPLEWFSLIVATLLGGAGIVLLALRRKSGWLVCAASVLTTLAVVLSSITWMMGFYWRFDDVVAMVMLHAPLVVFLLFLLMRFPRREATPAAVGL